jgi:hypothetical protein
MERKTPSRSCGSVTNTAMFWFCSCCVKTSSCEAVETRTTCGLGDDSFEARMRVSPTSATALLRRESHNNSFVQRAVAGANCKNNLRKVRRERDNSRDSWPAETLRLRRRQRSCYRTFGFGFGFELQANAIASRVQVRQQKRCSPAKQSAG